MTDIARFLTARYGEAEVAAEAATRGAWEIVELDGCDDFEVRADQSPVGRPRTEFRWVSNHVYDRSDAIHIASHDPARVLAGVAAKQAIVEWHQGNALVYEDGREDRFCGVCPREADWNGDLLAPCRELRLLAADYADHEDYDEAWKIEL